MERQGTEDNYHPKFEWNWNLNLKTKKRAIEWNWTYEEIAEFLRQDRFDVFDSGSRVIAAKLLERIEGLRGLEET
jgi:hypothetical protein